LYNTIKRGAVIRESHRIIFDKHGGIMRVAELKKEGFYYKKIQ